MSDVSIKCFKGAEIHPFIEDLANLRIKIFCDYPYLFDGDMDYEQKYLQTYADSAHCLMVTVFDGNRIIGVSTAIPLQYEVAEIKQPFHAAGLPVKEFFYLGESVLLPEYRGRGIYRQLFQHRETAAREQGFKHTVFIAVTRDTDDPRRPSEYVALDTVWQYFGYQRHPTLATKFSWKELGEESESLKPMHYWVKQL